MSNRLQTGKKRGGRPQRRRKARELALQALYQWQIIGGESVAEIEVQFRANNDMSKVDESYFCELLQGIARSARQIDTSIAPLLDRSLEQLDPVERAALRIGCYELMERRDVPYRVVINEGIELARLFGGQDSHRYINGILDKLAPRLRAAEVKEFRNRNAR